MSRHRPSCAVILRASALAFVRVGVGVASALAPVAAGGGGSCCAVLLLLEGGAANRDDARAAKISGQRRRSSRAADSAPSGWRRASARSAWRLATAAIMTECTCRVDAALDRAHTLGRRPKRCVDNYLRCTDGRSCEVPGGYQRRGLACLTTTAMSLFDAPKIVRKVEAGPSSHKRTAVWSGTVLGVDASRMNRMRTGRVARAAHPNRTQGRLAPPAAAALELGARPRLADPLDLAPEVLPWADVRLKNKFNPETTSSREWAPPATSCARASGCRCRRAKAQFSTSKAASTRSSLAATWTTASASSPTPRPRRGGRRRRRANARRRTRGGARSGGGGAVGRRASAARRARGDAARRAQPDRPDCSRRCAAGWQTSGAARSSSASCALTSSSTCAVALTRARSTL